MEFRKVAVSLLASSFALGVGAAAHAESTPGFYAGTGAGMYYINIDGLDYDENAMSVRGFGGFRVNDYLSLEAGYSHFFESSGDVAGIDVKMDGSAWDASVRPTLPIGDRFEAFGILGWSKYSFDVKVSANGLSASDSDSDDNMMYGLGGAYSLTDRWTVRGEWVAVDVSDADFGTVAVSATYNFR